jgi:hypothetical protein
VLGCSTMKSPVLTSTAPFVRPASTPGDADEGGALPSPAANLGFHENWPPCSPFRHTWVGRVAMVLMALVGTLPLIAGPSALDATTISGAPAPAHGCVFGRAAPPAPRLLAPLAHTKHTRRSARTGCAHALLRRSAYHCRTPSCGRDARLRASGWLNGVQG